MKEIGIEYYNAPDEEKEKINKEFVEEREKCTECFREQNNCEGFNALEKIAQQTGFEKLLIDPVCDKIHVEIVLGNKYVFYPEKCIFNHQKLAGVDKDFAIEMAEIVMSHEWEHHNDPSKEANIKRVEEFIKKYKEAEKGNLSEEEDKKEVKEQRKRFSLIESQTNLQMIIKNSNNSEDAINILAGLVVYMKTVYYGLQSLKRKISIESPIHKSFAFLDLKTFDKVIEKEIEIQESLIQKYTKLAEDQEDALSSDKKLVSIGD